MAASLAEASRNTVVIEPRPGWKWIELRDLWHYRELLYFLAWRDVKVRYKQTSLGAAWAVLQPLLAMAIFTLFFGRLARVQTDGIPYSLFVYAGLAPWTFFANSVSTGALSLLGSANVISKVYFPRVLVPAATVAALLLDFAIAFSIVFVLMAWHGVPIGLGVLAVIPLTLLLVLAALGISTLLAAVIVTYRDFRYVVPFAVQLWMFATPVVYPLSLAPERWRWLLALNPMTGIIEGYRSALLGLPFDLGALALSTGAAVVALVAGIAYFAQVERRFVDII
jgi:lipopolysaccharide transport system permease protein